MAKVRERFWVPRLRRLVKKPTGSCNGCKKFQAKAYQVPPPGSLPITRTQGSIPFQVVGLDFGERIRLQQSPKKEGIREFHLDLLSTFKPQIS